MKSKFTDSLAAFIPAARRDAANAALEEVGFGPNNFSVKHPETGPTTHYGLHAVDDGSMLAALQGSASVKLLNLPRTAGRAKDNFAAEAARLKGGRK